MALKNSITTADPLPWDSAVNLIHRLYKDKDYRMSLFVASGIFTGLRVSDIRKFRWVDLMGDTNIVVTEQKTKKRRDIKLNPDFQNLVKDCYKSLGIINPNEYCLLSNRKVVYSIQRLNVKLKEMKKKYKIPCEHISCHSLRKTFSRRIYDMSDDNKEESLIYLSMILSHSSTAITRRYIGLRKQQILHAYDLLSF